MSADQVAAGVLGKETRFASLQLNGTDPDITGNGHGPGLSLAWDIRGKPLAGLSSAAVLERMTAVSQREWRRAGFYRLLNRMLFRAAEPDQRLRMFEQFYGRPEPLIQRFYSAHLRPTDYLRIMTGKPPVPLLRAAKVFLGLS